MQFSTLAASLFALSATASVLPRSSETVTIENLYIRDQSGIQAAGFDIQPANVTCSADGTTLADYAVALCGDSKYRFAINGSSSDYDLRLYKELGVAFGLYGEVDHLPVYCRAGGNGADDFVCQQVAEINATIVSA
ncbi:hypothetical protein B0J14DRAFT_555073 [Halenospora varia]|nr:hypothetical protein B0J14DRAFT_555073 [Halenospora varia]